MASPTPSVKGTVDFYPEEMAERTWLYQLIRRVSESFGYDEYEAPLLESLELYAARSGEELVKEQAFVFADKGGQMIALRPELTPSLARMIAQRQNSLTFPLRWWSFGPFWRYERPQRGRTREFFQWNIDLIGIDSADADAELASIAASFFAQAGLSSYEIALLVNNRRLMDGQLEENGIAAEVKPEVIKLIDRKDKLKPDAWEAALLKLGISQGQIAELIAMLADEDLWKKSPELVRFFETTEAHGCAEYIHYAPYIVRGLDYYTGTVFEARDVQGEFRAILGGGRYDNLVANVGGTPLPGVGFAMGDKVIAHVLEKFGRRPDLGRRHSPLVLVTVFDSDRYSETVRLAAELRKAGIHSAVYPDTGKLAKQFKYAERIGARAAVILGPDEISNGTLTVKDLVNRTQSTIPANLAPEFIRKTVIDN